MIKNIPNKIIKFLRSTLNELKLVEFPSRKVAIKTGNLVVVISLVSSLGLYLLDWLFQVLRTLLISINI